MKTNLLNFMKMQPGVTIGENNCIRYQTSESSMITEMCYQSDTKTMGVIFKSSPLKMYLYESVGEKDAYLLFTADSIGKHFHKFFKNNHDFPFTEHSIEDFDDFDKCVQALKAEDIFYSVDLGNQ